MLKVDQGLTRKGEIVRRRLPVARGTALSANRSVWMNDFRTFGLDHPGPLAEAAIFLGAIPDSDRRAMALLDHKGRVLRANGPFRRFLAEHPLLHIRDTVLTARETHLAEALAHSLAEIAAHPGRQEPLLLTSAPPTFISLRALDGEPQRPPVPILLVGPPPADPSVLVANLCRLFALTEREAETAVALAEGRPVADIAAAEGVSVAAVRARLRRAKHRTGCTSDAALFDLLRRLAEVL